MENKTFTENYISKLPPAETGKRYAVADTKIPSLICRVTDKGNKSFVIYKKINGRPIKVTLGRYPDLSIEKARKLAYSTLDTIADKKNPNIENKKVSSFITLEELFREYMEKYSKKYTKPRTWQNNEAIYNRYFKKWDKRQVSMLSKYEIESLISNICNTSGLYASNSALVLLRHVINKGIEWGLNIPNPTHGIKKYKTTSRDRFLQADELKRFFQALAEEQNILVKNYLYLSLYTGQRRGNVLSMRWDDINFTNNTWYIQETKNGDPLIVPLVSQAVEILKNMQLQSSSLWVFPSKTSKSGHLEEPKKVWAEILKRADISNLRIHDIRRTLGSYEAISGTSIHIIGKSLGHKSSQATQIYARLSIDPIRQAMETATALIDELGNKKDE